MDDSIILNPDGLQLEDIANSLDYDELYRTKNMFLPPDLWEPIIRKEFITRVQASGVLNSSSTEQPKIEISAPSGSRIDAAVHEIAYNEQIQYHWMNCVPTIPSYAYAQSADTAENKSHRVNNKRSRSKSGHSTEPNDQGPQAKAPASGRLKTLNQEQPECDSSAIMETTKDAKICWDVGEVLGTFIEQDDKLGNTELLPHEERNVLIRARAAMAKAGEASQKEFTTAFQKRAMGTEVLHNISFHATQIQAQIAISATEMRKSTQNVIDNDPSISLESLPVSRLNIDTARRHTNWVNRALDIMRQAAYDERHDPRMKVTKHMRTDVATLIPWRPRYGFHGDTAPNSTQAQTDQHALEAQPTAPMQAEPSEPSKMMSVSLANLGAGGGMDQEEFELLEHNEDEMNGDLHDNPIRVSDTATNADN